MAGGSGDVLWLTNKFISLIAGRLLKLALEADQLSEEVADQ
jgi:hypothetical protein